MKRTLHTLPFISSVLLASALYVLSSFAEVGSATNMTFTVAATLPAVSSDFSVAFEPLEMKYTDNGNNATDYNGLMGQDHMDAGKEITSFQKHYGELHVTLDSRDVTSVTAKEVANTLTCSTGACAGKHLTANLYTDNAADWRTGIYTLTEVSSLGDSFKSVPGPKDAAGVIGKNTAMSSAQPDWYLPAYFMVEQINASTDMEGDFHGQLHLQFTPTFS